MSLPFTTPFSEVAHVCTLDDMADKKQEDRKRVWVKPTRATHRRALHLAVDADAKSFEHFMGDLIELGCAAYESGKRLPPAKAAQSKT